MNPFYDRFPETVMVNGEEYRIQTDFRNFLFLLDVLGGDSSDFEKAEAILEMYEGDKVPEDYEGAMLAIADFIIKDESGSDEGEEDEVEEKKKLLSYEKDAPFIISDFLRFYGIDLTSCEYLHWKKFQLLIDGLPEEAETKKRIAYRSVDAGKIKDKNEKARILQIQRQIAIENAEADAEHIGELFWGLMEI